MADKRRFLMAANNDRSPLPENLHEGTAQAVIPKADAWKFEYRQLRSIFAEMLEKGGDL
jgi:hypothetical protein